MTFTHGQTDFSWNTHCILTRVALSRSDVSRLNHRVAVVRLEDFLSSAQEELPELLAWYWNSIAKKSGIAPQRVELLGEVKTEADFLAALRLHPDVDLHYVRALLPEEVSSHVQHDQSREGPPGSSYASTSLGEFVPAEEVFSTFSDEPDWGMDQDLFLIEKYGYGPPPFGSTTGLSSQAPFHMAFLHENPLLRTILPRLSKSFMAERILVFLSLAKLAFRKRIDYWGWRFLAWAAHYLQDLTQPYHARAFPPSKMKMLRKLLFTPHFRKSSGLKRNYLKNRHMLFEATVHLILNDAMRSRAGHPFLEALIKGRDLAETPLDRVMKESSRIPARLSGKIDYLTVRLINDPRVEDINYALDLDADARIDEAFPKAATDRPHILKELVDQVSACLSEAGKVTRYAVSLARSVT
ncbi:MAG: hypothetical protein HY913_22105 [Desulfomonile tiedjei]|nr:hypothetical protein [Desulfomonile tiedjei]